ncbi:MAG: LysR substrate-binding domain-containing protein [Candidatus Acidiferrales bacterium]
MELRQLRYFIAVAENLSFSKAARQLHITVPPLSRQIHQLEEEFDAPLFVRDRKHVTLSDAGRLFLREAKALVTQAARMADSLRMAKCGSAGLVRIGVGPALGERVGRALIEHAKQYPAVDVQCLDILSHAQYRSLLDGDIDVAFLRPCLDSPELNSEFLFEEKLVVYIGKANPLAKRKSLRVKDLADQTLLLFDRKIAPGLYDKTLELYTAAGVNPIISSVAVELVPNNDLQALLLTCRKGIRIIPDETACRPAPGSEVAVVPLDEPGASVQVHMVWRKSEKAAAVLEFTNTARQILRPETRSALPLRERAAVAT